MPRYHVKITGRDYNAMADLVRKYNVHVARHTVEKLAKGYRVPFTLLTRRCRRSSKRSPLHFSPSASQRHKRREEVNALALKTYRFSTI